LDISVEYVAGVPIRLKKPFDLTFLKKFGDIFAVVDNFYGSGNLCFGAENERGRFFIKFAGAPKEKFGLDPGVAVTWLKRAEKVYRDLAHNNLIKFIGGEEIGGGYALIFEWTDAECIGATFPETRKKFLSLPIVKKLRAFGDILSFHDHVARNGYVAIDFYADQILYDFKRGATTVCDIDFYQKSPYYGYMGAWGSSDFVSPEECAPGQRVDEITMVYTMGATAFSIFADHDRTREQWTLDKRLYEIAKRAVSDERDLRQRSVRQFMDEWNEYSGRPRERARLY